MTKKILYLAILGVALLCFVATAATINQADHSNKVKTSPMKRTNLISGDEPIPTGMRYVPKRFDLIATSPGDTVGWTQYDYQSNGSSGRRVALDASGGVHFDWMNGVSYPSTRKISYNYLAPGGWQWQGVGTYIGYPTTNNGYCQLAVTLDDRAAATYHNATLTDNESTYVAIDVAPGQGAFDYYSPVIRFGSEHCIWPYIAIDRTGRIHVTASETTEEAGDEQTIGYTRSTTGGASWSTPLVIDTVLDIATVVTASPVSDKVAIVYAHPLDTSQYRNDIYYLQSTNGTTWDVRNGRINITDYGIGGDSLYAYTDLAAVYDYNDNLHIIWNAQFVVGTSVYYSTRLNHFDIASGTINEICRFDSTWADSSAGCDFGGWNFTIAKMSISVDPTNNALFTTYTSWNTGDCSEGGFTNGDIFLNYSTDGGATWTLRGNLTNSQTPDCEPGECDSDHWSSLAQIVDNNLHLFYVNDKDAGGIPQTEGTITDNPMLYLAYPNPVRAHAIPNAPALVFPYNDSSYSSGYFLFDWMDPVGAVSFTMQISSDAGFGTIVETLHGLTRSEGINTDSLELGEYWWRVRSEGFYGNSSFSAPYHFEVIPGCTYVTGDINNNGTFNGIDVTYGVGYFKGGNPPPYSCLCNGSTWFVAGDVNGNCSFNGIDITYMVSYFKGGSAPISCPACAP